MGYIIAAPDHEDRGCSVDGSPENLQEVNFVFPLKMFGDPSVKPNPCLGPIGKPPYYAVPINLGDLGTKGGLKADARARVLDTAGKPIPHLYSAGNNSGSPFGSRYPGAGATIGPAMTFGYVAAGDIAERARSKPKVQAQAA